MSKLCQVTGKKPSRGYKYAIRGIAKKKKGIGLKVTGKTKRRFRPNLVKKTPMARFRESIHHLAPLHRRFAHHR
jgi:ribosomal protein L28